MSVQAASSSQQATTIVREVTIHYFHEFGSVAIRELANGTFEEVTKMWTYLGPETRSGKRPMGVKEKDVKKMDASEALAVIADVAIHGPTSPFNTRKVPMPCQGPGL